MDDANLKEWALYYASIGWAVFPVMPPRLGGSSPGKAPYIVGGFKNATRDPAMIKQWWAKWPDANIGIATGQMSGGLVVIDLDINDGAGISGYETLRDWEHQHGDLPETCQSITGGGGYHLYFRSDKPFQSLVGVREGVDIRGEGGYIIAPPSLHKNGRRYEWEYSLDEFEIAEVDNLVSEFISKPQTQEHIQFFQMPEAIPEGGRVYSLVRLIGSLKSKGLSDEAIKAAVEQENNEKCTPPLTVKELSREVFPALKRDWKPTKPYTVGFSGSRSNSENTLIDKLIQLDAINTFSTNDKGSAELFAEIFKNISRYNPTQKDWMFYDGVKWVPDVEGMRAKKNAKALADAILSYAVSVTGIDDRRRENYLKYASKLMSFRDRNTMVNDAKDLNFFENTELDKNDMILNLKNCVLDLSGDKPQILEHNADLLLSKVCNTNYDPAATCKLWEKTIDEIMEGNTEKIRYLQKILGLCLTGITAEEELYFFYGASTRNGKTTICETVLSILNDYGATISPETLAVKANKDSRTASPDIAKLAGTRLVIASEPPKRMIFDTSLVKTLTGRDRVTARFLHQNEFTFTPKFKLLVNTNYLPTITDQTVFRSGRIRVVTFNKHFEEHEQNKKLKDELQKESSGILNWMIRGLYLYRKEGLEPPTAILEATGEYESDSDKIGRFISECLIKSDRNTSAKDVYETYSKWCSESGLGVDGRNNFYIELKTRGLFGASGTVNGKTVRNIVRGYVFGDEEFRTVPDGSHIPFE